MYFAWLILVNVIVHFGVFVDKITDVCNNFTTFAKIFFKKTTNY